MRRIALMTVLFVAGLTVAYGTTKSYDIVPHKGCVAETPRNTPVSQSYRNTLDSLASVSVWIGDTFDTASFKVDVYDSETGDPIAHRYGRHATQCWAWLDFPLLRDASPVRGRTYKVVVTRENGEPISFAYDTTDKYTYGCLLVGSIAHGRWGLAARTAV